MNFGLTFALRPRAPRGSTIPPWVEALRAPSGDLPHVVSDFQNGHYWAAPLGECTVTDLWVQDSNWADMDFNSIVPGSGVPEVTKYGQGALLQPSLFALIGVHFTAQSKAYLDDAQLANLATGVMNFPAPITNQQFLGIAVSTDDSWRSFLYDFNDPGYQSWIIPDGGGSQGAMNWGPSILSACIEGRPIFSQTRQVGGDTPEDTIAFLLGGGSASPVYDIFCERLVYWPLQSDADLPAICLL